MRNQITLAGITSLPRTLLLSLLLGAAIAVSTASVVPPGGDAGAKATGTNLTCREGCQTADDCEFNNPMAPYVCHEQLCIPAEKPDDPTPPTGTPCLTDLYCQATISDSCAEDLTCDDGYRCVILDDQPVCIFEQSADTDCPLAWWVKMTFVDESGAEFLSCGTPHNRCGSGACELRFCTTDADCPADFPYAGAVCNTNGLCGCLSDSDCGTPSLCRAPGWADSYYE